MVGVLRSGEVGVITCIECAALVTHHIAAVDANIMACVDGDAVSTEVAATFACATVSAVEPFYLQVGAVVGLHNFLVLVLYVCWASLCSATTYFSRGCAG